MKKKPTKPFGVWTSKNYRSQISANKRLYRTIYNHAINHLKTNRKVSLNVILKTLGVAELDNVRRGFYRSSWGRKLVFMRPIL